MIRIVVLGGGFAGIAACKALLKNTNRSEVQIILIDKNSYHLFTPSLYELASAEETTKNICIPLHEILKGIELIKGEVQRVSNKEVLIKQTNKLKDVSMTFDYLIIALGSESAYYGIPGLKEYSIPFKTLEDAVKIKEAIKRIKGKNLPAGRQVIIGGGGFSGTELACELVRHRNGQNLTVIQGSECLLKELDKRICNKATERLEKKGVKIVLGSHIKKVDKNFAYTDSEKYPYDVFVWTGGVEANSVQNDFEKDKRGDLVVNDKLQITNSKNIFAAGDIAAGYPWVAQIAEDEGKLAGENVANLTKGKPLKSYEFNHFGYVVPLGGHFAAAQLGKTVFMGFLGWVLEQIVLLRYLLSILPLNKAFKRWNRFEEYLVLK